MLPGNLLEIEDRESIDVIGFLTNRGSPGSPQLVDTLTKLNLIDPHNISVALKALLTDRNKVVVKLISLLLHADLPLQLDLAHPVHGHQLLALALLDTDAVSTGCARNLFDHLRLRF